MRYGKGNVIIDYDTLDFTECSKTNPHIELVNKELWRSVKGLNIDHRKVIRLSYYYGFSHREISDKLNMPFGSVKSKIRLAIRELRKIYILNNDDALLIKV
jgi:RNA polymerase sigma-70 factor (ECF subfamily)